MQTDVGSDPGFLPDSGGQWTPMSNGDDRTHCVARGSRDRTSIGKVSTKNVNF